MLEFELPEPEGQQGEPPQGAEEEEDLPECPDHRPSTYVEGKPRSIISLLLFYYHNPLPNDYGYILLHSVVGVDMTPLLHDNYLVHFIPYQSRSRIEGMLSHA